MKLTQMKKMILTFILSLFGSLFISASAWALAGPCDKIFHSYRTVVTETWTLPQSQTIYLTYTMTYNGYFKIKKPDNTIVLEVNRLSNSSPESLYLQAGTYTVVTYGGDGMAYGHSVNDNGVTVTITYMDSGKLVRVIDKTQPYQSSPSTGSFTPAITTKIYYTWSGGFDDQSQYPWVQYPSGAEGYLKVIDTSNNTIVLNLGPTAANGSFTAVAGRTYRVECYGGWHSLYHTSNIVTYTGQVDLTYDDTPPTIAIASTKANQWVKGDSDGSSKVDFNVAFSGDIRNSAVLLLVKVFFGPDGPTAPLYKSFTYNPANPSNIADNWPVPTDAGGPYQIYAELWENNGTSLRLRTSNKIKFNIDNTPPIITVTKLPDQSYYSNNKTPTINFTYTASDAGSGLGNVIVKIDDIPQQTYTGTLAQSGTYQWPVPNSGRHTISFIASDSAGSGNQTTQTFTIDIDNTSPEFPDTNLRVDPAPGYLSYVKSTSIIYSWAPVNEDHLLEYQIKIEAAPINNPTGWTTVQDWTSTGNETSYQYTIPAEYNGQMVKATVKAVDQAGNEASISKTIISDQSIPVVTFPGYAARFQTGAVPGTGKAVCRWNPVNDNIDGVLNSGSGIEHYEVALTETATAPDQNPPLQTAGTSANQYEFANISSSGTYYFWVRGVDRAGNRGAWAMSGPFPDFRVSGPENNTIITTAFFQASARSPLPGNKELRFKLKYKRAESGGYSSLPGDYQAAVLTPGLSDGIWNWYLELMEYDPTGNPIPDSLQTTEIFTFQMAGATVEPVTLQQFSTTPGATLQLAAMVAEPDRITEYRWDTGDGNIISGQSPQYSYGNQLDYDPAGQTASKVYPLTLTVTYSDGSTFTARSTVTVQNTACGTLYMNENWQGIHRLYGDVTVPEGVILTILPGTQVIIEQSPGQTGYGNALIINGTMNAGNGVVFRLAEGTTLAGWKGITITGQAVLDQVAVHNAQRAVTTVDTDNVTIQNCMISGNYTGVHVCGGHPAISGTLFSGNTLYAVKEEDGWPRVTHCIFTGNGIDYYHDTLTKITPEQLNALPERGNEGNRNQD